MKLSDNQVGDRLHAALEAVGTTDEGETIRGNTALVAARQTLSLLKQGLLIAAERNSDHVSTMMNQPVVPPSKTEKRPQRRGTLRPVKFCQIVPGGRHISSTRPPGS